MADNKSHVTDSDDPSWPRYSPEGEGRTDEQIRADVHALLEKGPKQGGLSLEVADGIVTLRGEGGELDAVAEQIRGVPSVKEVRVSST